MSRRKIKTSVHVLLATLIAIATLSCVREDITDCEIKVRFIYDHNILSTNALQSQVTQLALYIFDERGVLIRKQMNGSAPITNDFTMRIEDLDPGRYRFVAWAQSRRLLPIESYFSIPDLKAGTSAINELTYLMRRNQGVQQQELNNFLVGVADASADSRNGGQRVTVSFKKVNNKVKVILLPYISGGTVDVNNYEFSIVDRIGNGHINYDYSLLPDEQITYLPYFTQNSRPLSSEILPGNVDVAAVAQMNTSRITVVNAPRLLIVERASGREIFSANLPWLLSLTKMENHNEWSLQEYLDRQDEYSITLFFNESTWMSGTIIINGWVINNLGVDF